MSLESRGAEQGGGVGSRAVESRGFVGLTREPLTGRLFFFPAQPIAANCASGGGRLVEFGDVSQASEWCRGISAR